MGRPSATLGRRYRLSGKDSFRPIFKEGLSLRAEGLSLTALPNGLPHCRFGCTIRREAAPAGVLRNRLKRWVRESFRRNRAQFPGGLDLVVVINQLPQNPSFQRVERTLLLLAKNPSLRRISSS